MSNTSNKPNQGSINSLDTVSSDSVSIDFSIETVSSDIDILDTWNTDSNFDNIKLSEEEEMEHLRQSIIDISLQEDIENLNLVGIDEFNQMSDSDMIDYKNNLVQNADIIPKDLITTVNTHLFIINTHIANSQS